MQANGACSIWDIASLITEGEDSDAVIWKAMCLDSEAIGWMPPGLLSSQREDRCSGVAQLP